MDGLFSLKVILVFDVDGIVLGVVVVCVLIIKFLLILGIDLGMGYLVNVSLIDLNGNSFVIFVNGEYDFLILVDLFMVDKVLEVMNGEIEVFIV